MTDKGLPLDEAQEARNHARKHWHLVAIHWDTLYDMFPEHAQNELRMELIKIWYAHTLKHASSAQVAESMAEMFSHFQFAVDDEDEDEE